jgi:putative endonuclease
MGTDHVPPDRSKLARGAFGEALAAVHYERRGYRVLDRNWRTSTGELDLVLGRGSLYVFSEVKARRTDAFGPPAAAVGPAKQGRIRLLALEWLRAHGRRGDVRFDVVSIVGAEVEIIEGAF